MKDHGDTTDPVETLRSELERSEHRFRVVVDGAPDGVLIVRQDQIRYSNQVAAQMLGFEVAESAVGQSLSARLHPDDRPVALARMRAMAETGRTVRRWITEALPHTERDAASRRCRYRSSMKERPRLWRSCATPPSVTKIRRSFCARIDSLRSEPCLPAWPTS